MAAADNCCTVCGTATGGEAIGGCSAGSSGARKSEDRQRGPLSTPWLFRDGFASGGGMGGGNGVIENGDAMDDELCNIRYSDLWQKEKTTASTLPCYQTNPHVPTLEMRIHVAALAPVYISPCLHDSLLG